MSALERRSESTFWSGVPDALVLSQEAVRLMGMLAKGAAILNLPLALNTAFMTMLVPSAVGMILIALNQTVTGGLQGFGQASAPAKALFWGVAVKVALNLLLIRIPAVNIYGAPIASAACYLTAFCLGYRRLRQIAPPRRTPSGFVWRTALCAGIMGAAAWLGYPALYALLHSNGLALLMTMAGSAVLYFALLLVVQGNLSRCRIS